jgi:hypothetical protein
MKWIQFFLLTVCFVMYGQDTPKSEQSAVQPRQRPPQMLKSVTWDPSEHMLRWEVVNPAPRKNTVFTIKMDVATMESGEEVRRFSKQEAATVHRLMDLVTKYAAESTVWWEEGEGKPVQKDGLYIDFQRQDYDAADIDKLVPSQRQPTRRGGGKVVQISIQQ